MSTTHPDAATARPRTRSATLVILLCWLIVVFDGYDLIVYGTTLPHILKEPDWGLTSSTAGFIGSLAFAGMLVGALAAGDLADRLGRRRTILWMTFWFSLFTGLCYFAPNREIFGLFRFIAGVGLGGLVPSSNALTAEFVHPKNRSAVSTVMMSGVPIGGSIAALLGLAMLPRVPVPGDDWRMMYAVAFVAVLILLPICYKFLPESPAWLRAHGHADRADAIEDQFGLEHKEHSAEEHAPGIGSILRGRWLLPSIMFALATVATLLAWYGLGTWLPGLMQSDKRFDMGSPLSFLLALNIGAVIGSIVTAWAGVRFGPLRSAVVAAALAGIGLMFLLTYPSSLLPIYGALILAGVGTHGTQCLIIAAIASHYPAKLRGAGLGFGLGIGRIGAVAAPQVGGWLLAAGYGVGGNFTMFAGAAFVAAALLLVTMFVTKPSGEVVMDTMAH